MEQKARPTDGSPETARTVKRLYPQRRKQLRGSRSEPPIISAGESQIIINNHVVEGAQSAEVILYGGETLPAQIVGTDSPDDLAVVKVTPASKTTLTVAPLGDSSKLRVGQEVGCMNDSAGKFCKHVRTRRK